MDRIRDGDPNVLREQAGRLRVDADELARVMARIGPPTELPSNRGAAADRARETALGLRELAGRIGSRIERLSDELDQEARRLEVADSFTQDPWSP
jgi:hypothetical protein